ncbi:MAG: hypothetical protein ACJ8BF_05540 [Gemmatimonadales bacterium]
MRTLGMVAVLCLLGCASRAAGQDGQRGGPLPLGYGSLNQDDLSLRLRSDELEIRFIPLDAELTPLMARDTYLALHGLIESHRRGIDSVASRGGVSRPGLALVSFFGFRPDVRFDPQILALLIRSQVFQPLGIVPLSPRFTSGQLGVREQVSAIYVFEEDIPVNDSFTLSYGGLTSDWRDKQSTLDRERARVAARSRSQRPDTTK